MYIYSRVFNNNSGSVFELFAIYSPGAKESLHEFLITFVLLLDVVCVFTEHAVIST